MRSNQLSYEPSYFALPVMLPSHILSNGGGKRIRTDDPLLAKQVLSQLSYTPISESYKEPSKLNNDFQRLPSILTLDCTVSF